MRLSMLHAAPTDLMKGISSSLYRRVHECTRVTKLHTIAHLLEDLADDSIRLHCTFLRVLAQQEEFLLAHLVHMVLVKHRTPVPDIELGRLPRQWLLRR